MQIEIISKKWYSIILIFQKKIGILLKPHGISNMIHHLADQMISIDLDDGVKKNYAIFQDVLAKIK